MTKINNVLPVPPTGAGKIPSVDSVWRHKKSGTLYKVINIANLTATKAGYEPTIVYQSIRGGEVYARPLKAWAGSMAKFGTIVEEVKQ